MLPFQRMSPSRRHLPHLRLTAAILVAMLAAIAAGFDADTRASAERARRAELQPALGSLRLVGLLVSLPESAMAAVHAADPAACATASTVCAAAASLVGDDALARAIRRGRLERACGSRVARLLASSLPPPQA